MDLTSPSQNKLWTECERKWGFKYLLRIPVPQGKASELGGDVHKQVGAYLIEGKGFDFSRPSGEIAQAVVPLMPAPKTVGLRWERPFLLPSPTGLFSHQGSIDLYAPTSSCVPSHRGTNPLLGDLKTTGNLDFAHTHETLLTDIQAMTYATNLVFEDNTDKVDLIWWYVRTRKPHRSQRVVLHVSAAHVVEQFERIDAIGLEVTKARIANPKIDDLKPNPRMCDAYGGCPYRHMCNLSPAVSAGQLEVKEITPMSNPFLAQLRNRVAPATAPALVPPGTLVPAGTYPPAQAQAPAPAAPVAGPDALPNWATAPVDPLHARGRAINPPESTLPPAPPVGAAAPAPAPVSPAAAAPAPARRGRPAKAAAPAGVDAGAGTVASLLLETMPRGAFATFLRAWADEMDGAP